jgi:hypothetical protein
MLGGLDHAAAYIKSQADEAPHSLTLGAGPMLFMDLELPADRRTQDLLKAETLAAGLADIGFRAWAPGANDWIAGSEKLGALAAQAKASVLAANLKGNAGPIEAVRVFDVGGYKVGVAGISVPKHLGKLPAGIELSDQRLELEKAKAQLDAQGVKLRVLLTALPRGEALRLAELVPGFQVLIVGKPFDQGETNDPFPPPQLLGKTLVVQTPNHLQGLSVVDLFIEGDGFVFEDGSRISAAEQRESLSRRIQDLEQRIAGAQNDSADVRARRQDVERLKKELAELSKPETPPKGSFFRYQSVEVREKLGSDAQAVAKLSDYYRKVNDNNRIAFKDRLPPPVSQGQASYVGIELCSTCHMEEREFWNKTQHSKAYATLSTQHKEFNLDCVGCHVTGYEKPGGSTVTHVDKFKNVQCETCHGPGSAHVANPSDKTAIARGPARTLCGPQCHHPPHVKADWSVDLAWTKIIGPGHGR